MRTIFLYMAVLGCVIIGGGMPVSALAESQSNDDSSRGIAYLVNIGDILNNSERYNDELVTIEGRYLGWTGPGTTAQLTRSDWGIEDETGAIYVSDVYPHLDPYSHLDPFKDVGLDLIVSGVVTCEPEGPVIRAKIVTLTDAPNSTEQIS